MSRIKAYSEPTVLGLQLNKQETLNTSVTNSSPGIVLFSVLKDGNQGLDNAIFRPWRMENKELRSLFSVPGDEHLA